MTLRAVRPPPEAYPKELKTLGDHIKRKRIDLNMTQEQLAQLLRVHPQSISVWERNMKEPQTYVIPRIIEFLAYLPYSRPQHAAEWIRMVRKTNGFSQRRLAEALGMDKSTVQKWESEKHRPSHGSVRKIEALIGSFSG